MILFGIVCQSTSIDIDTNSLSIFGVMEQLSISEAAEGQIVALQHEHVSLWQRDLTDTPQMLVGQLRVTDPSGEEIGNSSFDVDLMTSVRQRVRHKLSAFPIEGEGEYIFETSQIVDGDVAERQRFPLTLAFEPTSSSE